MFRRPARSATPDGAFFIPHRWIRTVRSPSRRTSSPASCGTYVPVASRPVPNASHRTSPHSVSSLPVHGSGWSVLEVPSMPSHVPSFRCENSLTAAEICGMVSMGVKLRAKWRTLLQRGIPFSKRVRFQPPRSLLQRLRGGFLSLPQSIPAETS